MLAQNPTRFRWTLSFLALLLVYFAGVGLREHRLNLTLPDSHQPFWLESAQHYRSIRFIAEGKTLPDPDRQLQWPDGFKPTTDTVVQEYVIGGLARALQPADLPAFVRSATRYVYCLIIFPLFWLCYELTRRRWAALFAVGLFITLPPALERSTGLVVFRENVALPIIAMQIAALYAHFRREKGSGFAWLSGACLLLAHFTWKVSSFYQLFVLMYLAILCIWQAPGGKVRSAVYALAVPPLAVSIALPVALHIDRYWGGIHAALTGGLLAVCLGARWVPSSMASPWRRLATLGGLSLALRSMLPGPISYDHAWDTLIAKVRFLGQKPEDPALLSIHARHYWTGNYRSPTAARAFRDFLLPAFLAVMTLQRLSRAPARAGEASPPTQTGERSSPRTAKWGRLHGLARGLKAWLETPDAERYGQLFLLLGLTGFMVGYLMFLKFGTFLAVFITPAVAMGALTLYEQALHRWREAILVLLACLGVSLIGAWTGRGAESVASIAGGAADSSPQEGGQEYTVASMNELAEWIQRSTSSSDVFLTSWALAPFLFTYQDRNTNLHSYFECDVVNRFEEFNRRLFQPLPTLHAFARQYQSTYLIYEANFLLRIDRWMSYRYVADHLRLDGNEAAWRLHYAPDNTPGFQRVFQNDYFRVYKILPHADEVRPPLPGPYAPLFDPGLPGAQPDAALEDGPKLLYGTLEADYQLQEGRAFEAAGDTAAALQAYRHALQAGPYHLGVYRQTIALLSRLHEERAARQLAEAARSRFGPDVTLPDFH